MGDTLRRLQSVSMEIHIGRHCSQLEENKYIPFAAFFSRTKHLQEVYLNFDNVDEDPMALRFLFFDLTHALSQIHWPRLRTFDLAQVETTADSLIEFLRNHSKTLGKLSLTNMTLLSGRWTDIFDDISEKWTCARCD